MKNALKMIKALADETRLRLAVVLADGPMNVQELTDVLGMGQSRISRHLRLLHDAGLAQSRREGSWIYYHLDPQALPPAIGEVVRLLLVQLRTTCTGAADLAATASCRKRRAANTRTFFDGVAGQWRTLRPQHVDEQRLGQILRRAVPHVPVIADLGCGTGETLRLLAGHGASLIGVDQSEQMIAIARTLAAAEGQAHIEFRLGEFDHMPLRDEEADAAVLSLVLHHLADPSALFPEINRVLKPAGHIVIVDLAKHDREWLRDEMGDLWLGFQPEEVRQWLDANGFERADITLEQGGPAGVNLIVACARKNRGIAHVI